MKNVKFFHKYFIGATSHKCFSWNYYMLKISKIKLGQI